MRYLKFIGKTALILGVLLIGFLVVEKVYFKGEGSFLTSKEEKEKANYEVDIEHFAEKEKIKDDDPFAILLLGVDGKQLKNVRSDSIMLGIVNPKDEKMSLLSIYRDLFVTYPEMDRSGKINAAYNYGGVDLTAATVQEIFDVPIKYYATINFNGFKELVDAIGGVTIDVEKNISDKRHNIDLIAGEQKLDGERMLHYVRFRKDGEGDFGRTRRQRQAIAAIADQTLSLRNVTKVFDIYDAINNNFDTNISNGDLTQLAFKLRNVSGEDIETIKFDAYPTSRNGVSYVETSQEEIERIKEILQRQLAGESSYFGEEK